MYLFDLIDHHKIIYGKDFIGGLYRPDPKQFSLRIAAETLRSLDNEGFGVEWPPTGYEAVAHRQALKMVRVLQLHFAGDNPTIAWQQTLENYLKQVPQFDGKAFGVSLFKKEMASRYPVDRGNFTPAHAEKCVAFVRDACKLLRDHVTPGD